MSICKEILDEINKLRANPRNYVDIILKYKDYFEGNILKIPGEKAGIQTKEGAAAYEEAANFLREAKYVQELIPSKGLFSIAENYFDSIKEVGMEKIDSVDLNQIIDKYGSFNGEFCQLMECGSSSPEQIVISFLVCDGDADRVYRANLLNPNLKKIGVASGENDSAHCTILVASTEFQNKDNSDDTKILEEKSNGIALNSPSGNLLTLSDMINLDSKNEEEEAKKKEAEEEEKRKKAEEEEEERKKREEEERLKREEEERGLS